MGDMKIFGKNKIELQTPVYTMKIYSQDIRMELKTKKCAMMIMKNWKEEQQKK